MKTTALPSKSSTGQRRSNRHNNKFSIFTTLCLLAMIILITYIFNTNTSISFNFNPTIFTNHKLIINYNKQLIIQDHLPLNLTTKKSLPDFESRTNEFFKDCKLRFFMTWISSPSILFGERELLAVEALFKSNPDSCLMIISNSMDSDHGFQLLKPVMNLGFRVQAIEPDFHFLFENTPAKSWFKCIQNRKCEPGEIPLAQNLSNLIRLVVLYKFGGVYLDTDFIAINDFSGLRNSIGAQSVNRLGKWTRLNNAVLVFDKKHPLVYKFIEEYALSFNGNRWGFNGPYLVSRVVERNREFEFSVLGPVAFYLVSWRRIEGLFRRPVGEGERRWVEAKVVQLKECSYGLHLWNKQSRRLRIEQESVLARLLLSDHSTLLCKKVNQSLSHHKLIS